MSMNRFRLDGRVALVTGASGALGAEFARVLSGAGARVVLAARRVDAMQALAQDLGQAHAVVLDVTDPDSIRAAVDGAEAWAGAPVDLLVNNSGIATPGAALSLGDKAHDQTLTFWRRCTVPPDTPVQNKLDLKLRLTGTEAPIL